MEYIRLKTVTEDGFDGIVKDAGGTRITTEGSADYLFNESVLELKLVDEDTNAFNKIMEAFGLPKATDDEKKTRTEAIQEATKYATEVPFKVMQLCYDSMEVIKAMAEIGNPNSVTDAGVGALCARSAVMGAFLNVKINAAGLINKTFAEQLIEKGNVIEQKTQSLETEILNIVNSKI